MKKHFPSEHLAANSAETVRIGSSRIATLTAVVLGILVGSASTVYRMASEGITQGGAELILLDRNLKNWGPETAPIREDLKQYVQATIKAIWEKGKDKDQAGYEASVRATAIAHVVDSIRQLSPKNLEQEILFSRIISLSQQILQTHWTLIERESNGLPGMFLAVLLLWMATVSFTQGLFSPLNPTVIAILAIYALSVAGAIFLIDEMSRPFNGYMKVPVSPLHYTLKQIEMNQP